MSKRLFRGFVIFFLMAVLCATQCFAISYSDVTFKDCEGNFIMGDDGTKYTLTVANGTLFSSVNGNFPTVTVPTGYEVTWTTDGVAPIGDDATVTASTVLYAMARPADEAADSESVQDFIPKINKTIRLFRSIALPLAALALAYSALEMLFGGEKEMEKAKVRIKLVIAALAVMYLLPLVINSVVDFASQHAWDPASPTT